MSTGAGSSVSECLHQGPHIRDRDDALHVVGQNLRIHFRTNPFKCSAQEVGQAHPRLNGPKRLLQAIIVKAGNAAGPTVVNAFIDESWANGFLQGSTATAANGTDMEPEPARN